MVSFVGLLLSLIHMFGATECVTTSSNAWARFTQYIETLKRSISNRTKRTTTKKKRKRENHVEQSKQLKTKVFSQNDEEEEKVQDHQMFSFSKYHLG